MKSPCPVTAKNNLLEFESLLSSQPLTSKAQADIDAGRLTRDEIDYTHLDLKDKSTRNAVVRKMLPIVQDIFFRCSINIIETKLNSLKLSLSSLKGKKRLSIKESVQKDAKTHAMAKIVSDLGGRPMKIQALTIKISESDWEGPCKIGMKINLMPEVDFQRHPLSTNPSYIQQNNRHKSIAKKLPKHNKKLQTQLNEVRLYAYIAHQLNTTIDKISEEDVKLFKEKAEKLEKTIFHKEKVSKKGKAHRKKLRTHKHKEKQIVQQTSTSISTAPPQNLTLPPSSMQEKVKDLNRHSSESSLFTLHPRITRWQHCEENEFEKQRHNLAGMASLLADSELCRCLSLPYTWENDEGEQQSGKAFYTTMITPVSMKLGIINVAISLDNIIFHAMFRELASDTLPLSDLQETFNMDNSDINWNESLEEKKVPWEQVSNFSFQLNSDDNIELHVGQKVEERVIFRFHQIN